jgi:hypothetical protein
VLFFVHPVLFDRGNKLRVVRAALPDRRQNPVQGGITAMLVVDIDRGEDVEITAPQPVTDAVPAR